MSVLDRIKAKVNAVNTVKISFMEEELAVKLLTMNELINLPQLKENEIIEFIASKVIDPETMEPVFTSTYLSNELPNKALQELIISFYKANGSNVDEKELEDIEKN